MKKVFIKNRKNQNVCVVIDEVESSKGIAFVMHGLGGFKEQLHIVTFAEALRESGYFVILFDTTNTLGESDGNYEKATLTNYYEDLEDVIKWAKTQKWYREPFILTGHSMGGYCTAFYAENYPQEVLALAPISTVVSGKLSVETHEKFFPKEFKNWEETGYLIKTSTSKPGVIKKLSWNCAVDWLNHDLFPKIQNLTMPVLLIVGDSDTSTPMENTKLFFEALIGPKELYIIKGAPHTFRDKTHLEEIKNIFLDWLRVTVR
jgi:pimeloyl-ACP methyl ester carboxylesterase